MKGSPLQNITGGTVKTIGLFIVNELLFRKYPFTRSGIGTAVFQYRHMAINSLIIAGKKIFFGSIFTVSNNSINLYAGICFIYFNKRQHLMPFIYCTGSNFNSSNNFTQGINRPVSFISEFRFPTI